MGEESEEVRVEEGDGEEGNIGPDVEHLGNMEGGNVVGFVTWKCVSMAYGRG